MKKLFLLAIFTLLFPLSASATIITTDLTSLSGNTWQAEYTISNDALVSPIDQFTIWFDLGFYENVSVVSTPTDWDPLVIQPDASIPDDGFYDVLALGAGISSGDLLAGFTVSFDWLGGATPMSQLFEIIDPSTFTAIDSGQTSLVVASVSEPSIIALLALGLVGLVFCRRKTLTACNN